MERSENRKIEKGISLDDCLDKANSCIEKNGICLFVMDAKNSSLADGNLDFQQRFNSLIDELNTVFEEYLPENNLAAVSRIDKGFGRILGDGVLAGITDSLVISGTVDYIAKNYPDLSFYYNVAADGYDEEGIRTIK